MSTTTGTNGASQIHERVIAKQVVATQYFRGPGWKSYTPTLSTGAFNAAATYYVHYRITDATLEVRGRIAQTSAGTLGSGSYNLSLPSGCTAVEPLCCSGTCFVKNVVAGVVYFGFADISSNAIRFTLVDTSGAAGAVTGWAAGGIANTRLDQNTIELSFEFTCEISPQSVILGGTQ